MAFTFVRPLLLSVSGFDVQWIGGLLFAYGIAGIAGNFLMGILAARYTEQTLLAIALGLLLTPAMFLLVGSSPLGGGMTLLIWGLAYGGVSVGLMNWMMKVAAGAVEVATALYVGAFNVGVALGSWLGGQMVDSLGLAANLWLAGVFAAAAVLLCFAIGLQQYKAVTGGRSCDIGLTVCCNGAHCQLLAPAGTSRRVANNNWARCLLFAVARAVRQQ